MSPEETGGSGGASESTGGAPGSTGGAPGSTGGFHTDGGGPGTGPGGSGASAGSGGADSPPIDSGPPPDRFRWQSLLQIRDVARGNAVYVAVGSDIDDIDDPTPTGVIYTSADGFHWNQATAPSLSPATDVAYGNGAFVAMAPLESITKVYRSEDGTTWTAAEIPGAARTGGALAFGNGVFVATLGDRVVRSADGKNWQSAPHAPLDGIEFGAGTFVGWNTQFESSKNGVDWVASGPVRGSRQYNQVRLFGSEAGFDGVLGYHCCFGEVPPSFATIQSGDGAVWKLTEGASTVPALEEPGVCVNFSQHSFPIGGSSSFSVGTSCDSANPLVTDEGFTPMLVRHEGPAYLFAGYAGIYSSKDGLHYEPTLIHSQKIPY